jgi:glycosyltransferase involved in cell wall biosynthesis
LFVNTSDTEGFPNSYLQAWIRGTPVVAFFDPDGLIRREGLGVAVNSLDDMADAIAALLHDKTAWLSASMRCRAYMADTYGEERILAPYLDIFRRATQWKTDASTCYSSSTP